MKISKIAVLALYATLLILSFAIIYLTDRNVLTIDFLNGSGEYLTGDRLSESLAYQDLQKWIYFSQTFYLTVKLGLVTMTIYTALFLAGSKCKFTGVLGVVITSEFIFLIAAAIKVIAFSYTFHPGTLSDWHKFHPFSALYFFDNIGAIWQYPLQVLNLFEFTYWFVLAFGLSKLTVKSFDHSLMIVLSSYVPALVIWTLTLSFFSVVLLPNHI